MRGRTGEVGEGGKLELSVIMGLPKTFEPPVGACDRPSFYPPPSAFLAPSSQSPSVSPPSPTGISSHNFQPPIDMVQFSEETKVSHRMNLSTRSHSMKANFLRFAIYRSVSPRSLTFPGLPFTSEPCACVLCSTLPSAI